jgi:hypothetical protein
MNELERVERLYGSVAEYNRVMEEESNLSDYRNESDDFSELLKEARPDLSEEQRENVLESIAKDHSDDYGVSADTLFFWADTMYPKKDPDHEITTVDISEAQQIDVECLNCGEVFKLTEAYKDELGLYTSCVQCQGSFDVDLPSGEGGEHG